MARKAQELAEVTAQIEEARASKAHANEVKATVEARRPWVESLVHTVMDRRTRNGFGEEYTISQTPRRKPA